MPRLTLSFLGPFQASLEFAPAKGFESDKVRALLAYLVVEAGQPHRRDSLAALLWPEQPQDVALKNFRHVLYKLRQVLGDDTLPAEVGSEAQTPYLVVTTQTVQLNSEASFHLDVTEFTGIIEACQAHRHRRMDVCGSCHARFKRAAELYRGEFLAGFGLADCVEFEEWMLLKREDLHRQAVSAFVQLAAYSEARGAYAEAARYARRQLEFEPWNEEAHSHVMRLLWLTGQRTAALAQYKACCRVLSDELGIEPSAQTTELYRRILVSTGSLGDAQDAADSSRTLHNLPAQSTPFIGREQELGRIAERLESPDRRLLTLLGPGGIGKSRLALEAASAQLGAFEDGIYFVPMAPVASASLIVSAISQALAVQFAGKEDEEGQLLRYLSGREMLIVMDNFEHLLDGVDIICKILDSAPRVSMLVTSRTRLNVRVESVIDLAGLQVPPAGSAAIQVESASQFASVRLFLERAQAREVDFCLTSANAPSIVEICRIVAGLPLAIELAAVNVRDYTCAEIAAAIQSNLDFLESDLRDVMPAHRSIRAVFNYSWQLLAEQERGAFRRLSVFQGGWDSEAAEKIAGTTRSLLASLSSKSLISSTAEEAGMRHNIHEVLRQYAAEELAADPQEEAATLERHAAYYLALAEAAEPHLRGAEQGLWLSRLDKEHANMQAAIRWSEASNHREIGLRLGGALWQFWVMRAHYATGRALLSGFDLQGAECSPTWAKALFGAGRLAVQQGDHSAAQDLMGKSIALYEKLGDEAAVRRVLIERARTYLRQGDYARGEELAGQALQLARAANDLQSITGALTHLGHTAANRNDYALARRLYTECLQIQRSMKDSWGIAWTLTNLGNVAHIVGDSVSAHQLVQESLSIRREIHDRWGVGACLVSLGSFAIDEGRYDEAREYITQSLVLRRELGDSWAIAESLIYYGFLEYREGKFAQAIERWWEGLPQTYAQQNHFFVIYYFTGLAAATLEFGNIDQAVRLAGAVTTLLDTLHVKLAPTFQSLYDRVLATGQAQLGEAACTIAWTEGGNMTLDAAYEAARTLQYATQ